MNLSTEPSRLASAVTAAVTATIGVLTLSGVLSPEVGGGVTAAVAAWIVVAGELIRSRVVPASRVVAHENADGDVVAGAACSAITGSVVEVVETS